jgi:dTDP-4-dehydrorhamnose 3,5-epimerase
MRFETTNVAGLIVIRLDWRADERGAFARLVDAAVFAGQGLPSGFPQVNLSVTHRAGTLRGLHFQRPPHAEAKLVRCVRGTIHDVVVDLRPCSPSFRRWHALTLTAGGDAALYVPQGCAHGFQTLADETEVLYQMSAPYAPDHAGGVRFDDPALGIAWPCPVTAISDRDRAWPLLEGYSSDAASAS